MKNIRTGLIISAISLVIALASAIIVQNMALSSGVSHPNWDNFNTAVWLTLLITIPASCIFIFAAITTLITYIRRNHMREK
jgi:ABC-type Fe3+ transport system permease subunit